MRAMGMVTLQAGRPAGQLGKKAPWKPTSINVPMGKPTPARFEDRTEASFLGYDSGLTPLEPLYSVVYRDERGSTRTGTGMLRTSPPSFVNGRTVPGQTLGYEMYGGGGGRPNFFVPQSRVIAARLTSPLLEDGTIAPPARDDRTNRGAGEAGQPAGEAGLAAGETTPNAPPSTGWTRNEKLAAGAAVVGGLALLYLATRKRSRKNPVISDGTRRFFAQPDVAVPYLQHGFSVVGKTSSSRRRRRAK